MTMQHRRNGISGEPIVIRPFAEFKQDKAINDKRIKIAHIGMAAKRIADDYPSLARWFCLRIVSGREFLVEEALKIAGVDALVPTRKGDKIMKRHRIIPAPTLPVLPGYVLVRCVPSPGAMVGLRRFERVIDVVGGAETPYRIPLKFVNKFIEKAEAGHYDHRTPDPADYHEGETVRVIDGPFASFPAKVVEVDAQRNRIKVDVNIFGRDTPVELDIAQIEKV
ncbi:transcription termination/antitermination protein NusG [Rhizobium mongolense]|uniref:Transcription termination/antitermination protein NusG n=1 Tax=Rhizobium mongolense TaxID=57676 RepID=A0A7W6WGJ1_9HYPH|nr:transcription termination/antitermination protein NusG [Rhizobium mongolense]MBB4277040.1 transcriptional antiterminator NusG [Rhizobium mongolense]